MKRKLGEVSAAEFLEQGLKSNSEDDSNSSEDASEKKSLPKSSSKKQKVLTKKLPAKNGKLPREASSKFSVERLKQQDPEFFEFLKGEDKSLLEFQPSDGDDDDEDDSDFEDSENEEEQDVETDEDSIQSTDSEEERNMKNKKKRKSSKDDDESDDEDEEDYDDEEDSIHKFPSKLEEVTDSEDEEEEDEEKTSKHGHKDQRKLVTMKMVHSWTDELRKHSVKAFRESVNAFRAAVDHAGSKSVEKSNFKVEGSAVFNAIIRLCIRDILPMLSRFLRESKRKDPNKLVLPSHSPQYKLIRKEVTSYLQTMLELTGQLAEPAVLTVILKHINQMVPYYAGIPKLTKAILRRMISIWSSGDEMSRVLAFLAINKMMRLKQHPFLEFTIKHMYMAYVKNCKFTSPTTLPMINFMQRTLVEILALNHEMTYQYSFMYIRQLAIHLRNAITVKKKETCQSVYNWQYIHSMQLWTKVLSQLYPSEVLEPLIYPLTQTIIGTIKLIPTARYYPLRFHCVKSLTLLSKSTNTFIPVLPFLVEMLELTNFNKKHKSLSFKPFNFACILKLSKAQLLEKAFRDTVIEQLYDHFMEVFHVHAHTVGFPELVLPAVLQMKKFVKTCKIASYTKQIKQIVDKVDETSRVITRRRKTASLSLQDSIAVEAWERRSKEEGTPLGKYYATWRKLRDRELQHEISKKDQISTDDLPVITKRTAADKKATAEERKEFKDIFDTDSDESDDDIRFLPKEQRPKKQKKTIGDSDDEDLSDFDENEMEQLAGSADEDEEDDEEVEVEEEDGESSMDEDGSDEDEKDEEDMDNSDTGQEDIVEDFKFSSDEES